MKSWNWKILTEQHSPFFIYDLIELEQNLNDLKKQLNRIFPNNRLNFSLKSNPNLQVVEFFKTNLDGFDLSSFAELEFAQEKGIAAETISLSGPGKTDGCLSLALKMNIKVVQIDSLEELDFILESPVYKTSKTQLSLRLQTPDVFSEKLGLSDEVLNQVFTKMTGNLKPLLGLHAYLGRENFTSERAALIISKMDFILGKYPQLFQSPSTLFLGPGISAGQDLSKINMIEVKHPICLEIGRALIGPIGYYGVPVLSVKQTDTGADLVIIDGGLQHLGSPLVTMGQSLNSTKSFMVRNGQVIEATENKEVLLGGSLCLWHDILHPRLSVPKDIQAGDYLVFENMGSYGLTAGVPHFIGERLAEEWCVDTISPQGRRITAAKFKSYHESFDFKKVSEFNRTYGK